MLGPGRGLPCKGPIWAFHVKVQVVKYRPLCKGPVGARCVIARVGPPYEDLVLGPPWEGPVGDAVCKPSLRPAV